MHALRSRRWLAVLSAWLLLLGTAMPALVRMTCVSGGHTVLSLGQADDCCPEPEHSPAGAQFHPTCCEVDRTSADRTAFTLECGPSLGHAVDLLSSSGLELRIPDDIELVGYGLSSRPPPLLTCERLSQVGSYLL